MRQIVTLLVIMGIIAMLGVTAYWLWQRQPQITADNLESSPAAAPNAEVDQSEFLITTPKTGEILNSTNIQIEGKTKPGLTILHFSSTSENVVKSNNDGYFKTITNLPEGLSLNKFAVLDNSYTEIQNITLPIYVSTEDDAGKFFVAGTVKKLFDQSITLSTTRGELDIKTSPKTELSNTNAHKDEEIDIRVGDFLLAIGPSDLKNTAVEKAEIFRQEKPQITKNYAVVKVASTVKNNKFSTIAIGENKPLELSLNRNSSVMDNDQKAAQGAIKKDRLAIAVYGQNGPENLISLLYFL